MPEAEQRALLERFDNHAQHRNLYRIMAEVANEWAGIPMSFEDEQLRIAPGYPFKEVLDPEPVVDCDAEDTVEVVNSWWSTRKRLTVVLVREEGKLQAKYLPPPHAWTMQLRTIGLAPAWGIKQEQAAVHLLAEQVNHHKFKTYLLTGGFLESSEKSGITYVFRRLRPTLAISTRGDKVRTLCALCMHPIGYYDESGAGAMCPTDDVIAHLTLMRADEHRYWKISSQHPVDRVEAMA